jgi:hypothetical protein
MEANIEAVGTITVENAKALVQRLHGNTESSEHVESVSSGGGREPTRNGNETREAGRGSNSILALPSGCGRMSGIVDGCKVGRRIATPSPVLDVCFTQECWIIPAVLHRRLICN